jgi:hypothetical protein
MSVDDFTNMMGVDANTSVKYTVLVISTNSSGYVQDIGCVKCSTLFPPFVATHLY